MKKILLCALSLLIVSCNDNQKPFQGYIEGDYTYLSSPQSGDLVKLNVHRGETVKKNTLLFALDDNPEVYLKEEKRAHLEKAEDILHDMQRASREEIITDLTAKREHAEAIYRFLTKKHKRHKELVTSNVLDKNTYDETVSNLERTRALIKQYTAQIKNAKRSSYRLDQIKAQEDLIKAHQSRYKLALWQLEQKKGYAPSDGLIVDTYYRVGEYVKAAAPIIKLLNTKNKHVLFFVPEPKLATFKLGQTLFLNCDNCPPNQKARLTFISPKAEFTPPLVFSQENNHKLVYKMQAKLLSPKPFHPGQPVTVRITPAS